MYGMISSNLTVSSGLFVTPGTQFPSLQFVRGQINMYDHTYNRPVYHIVADPARYIIHMWIKKKFQNSGSLGENLKNHLVSCILVCVIYSSAVHKSDVTATVGLALSLPMAGGKEAN